ncbi:MAG: hypothetical protein ACI9FB_002587 [Candidatus Azotimanducaceae bacterium]|jgi:hypothetical protein
MNRILAEKFDEPETNDDVFEDESPLIKPSVAPLEVRRRIEEILEERRLRNELDFDL